MNYQSYIIHAAGMFGKDPAADLKKRYKNKEKKLWNLDYGAIPSFGDLIDIMTLRQKVLMEYQTAEDMLVRRRRGNLLKLIQKKILAEFFEATNLYLANHGSNEEAFINYYIDNNNIDDPSAEAAAIAEAKIAFQEVEEVTAANIKVIDRITKAQMSGHLRDQIVAYEQFLGAVHNSGPLAAYLFDDYSAPQVKAFLDHLSNMSPKQLKMTPADQSFIEEKIASVKGIIRISQRDNSDNKKELLKLLNNKYHQKLIVDEFIGEFTGQVPIEEVEFSDEDMSHILPFIEKMNLKYEEPQMISLNDILEHSENSDLRSRISAFNDGTINTDNTNSSATYIRSPENINKFKSMDPSTAPPIAISGTGKLEWGFHRTIAAISRGDKEILAWRFE